MSCSVAQVVVLLLAVVAAVHGSSASSALGSELAPMPASFEGAPLSPGRTRAVIDRQDAAIEQLEDMCERQAADLDQARQRERDASRTLAKLKGDLSRSLQACEVDHQPLLEAHQACPEEKAKQQAQISDLVRQRRHLESQVQRLQAALEGSNALRRKALEDKAALFSKLEACRQMAQQDADWRSMLMERDEELAAATAEIASLTRSLAEREADLALAVEQLRELQLVCRDDHEIHQRGGNGVAITATRPWTTSPTVPTLEQELQRAGYDNSLPEHIVEDQNASKDGTSETVGEPPAPGAEGPCSCRRSPTPSPEQECQTARPGIAPGPTIKAQSAPHAAATESNVAGARNDQAHRLSRLQAGIGLAAGVVLGTTATEARHRYRRYPATTKTRDAPARHWSSSVVLPTVLVGVLASAAFMSRDAPRLSSRVSPVAPGSDCLPGRPTWVAFAAVVVSLASCL